MRGIQEHWNLGAECGGGSFTNINQDEKSEDIATPFDSMLFVNNEKLNSTYIAYGYSGIASFNNQSHMDKMNYAVSKSTAAKRIAVKGQKELYNNSSWDLVDKVAGDSLALAKIDLKMLPESLQNKSRNELAQIVKKKNNERGNIQQEITRLNTLRESYLVAERLKSSLINLDQTLESAIETIIKLQARKYNMIIE